ncbi:DUF2493 domain-containing protein, partial [Sphingomonas sp. HH69]
ERYLPKGPIVVASGHADWHDWQPIWDRLDLVRKRVPHMTLVTTAQRKGFDAIVAAWAGDRGVPLVAYTLAGSGRKAPFLRNRKMVELKPVEAVLGEGSGIQANLYQALRKAGICQRRSKSRPFGGVKPGHRVTCRGEWREGVARGPLPPALV